MITHIHPDHYGLAGRLREITSADLSFHRLERLYIESRYADADDLLAEMREWLRLNGTPQGELDQLNRGSTSMMERVQIAYPDRTLDGDPGPPLLYEIDKTMEAWRQVGSIISDTRSTCRTTARIYFDRAK